MCFSNKYSGNTELCPESVCSDAQVQDLSEKNVNFDDDTDLDRSNAFSLFIIQGLCLNYA